MKHCVVCGTTHEETEDCPAGAFAIVRCRNCAEESLLPGDALFGLSDMHCACGSVGDYIVERATNESIVRVWPEYGKGKNKEKRQPHSVQVPLRSVGSSELDQLIFEANDGEITVTSNALGYIGTLPTVQALKVLTDKLTVLAIAIESKMS